MTENIFGGGICALRLALLGVDTSEFGGRIAVPLLLLEKFKIGLGGGKLILGLLHFAGRGRAILLQSLQGVEIAERCIALSAGFYQL